MNRFTIFNKNGYKIVLSTGLFVIMLITGWMTPRLRRPEILGVVGLAALVIILFLLSRKIEYGILAILFAAGFVRFTISTGTQSEIVASFLLAAGTVALWIVNMFVVEKRARLKPASTNVPLIGFMAVCVISYAWSSVFRDVLVTTWKTFPFVQLASLSVMLLLPAVFLLVSNCIEDIKWLKVTCLVFVAIGVLTVPYLVWPIKVGRTFFLNMIMPGELGLLPLWGISITFGLAIFNRKMPTWQRVVLLCLAILWTFSQIKGRITWLSVWVPPILAIYIIAFLRSKRLFLVMLVCGMVIIGISFGFFYEWVYRYSIDEGDTQRVGLAITSLELVKNHPLFGTGPAGYAAYYMTYHPGNARSTHNNYLDILAQTGIVGFSLYVWFFGSLFRSGYLLYRKLRGQRGFEEAFVSAMLGGCGGAIFAMMLGDWVIPFVYNVGIRGFDHAVFAWFLLGGMMALHHIVDKRSEEYEASRMVSGLSSVEY